MSSTPAVTITETKAVPTRLIDADSNKTIFFKKVVVFGAPGSGVEVLSEGFKKLGLKVYDEAEALKNHERDLPLWLEAAQSKKAGKPYDKYDMERFLGKYDAVIGYPATCFAEEMIAAFQCTAKFIVVTEPVDVAAVYKHRSWVHSALWAAIDPKVLGKLYEFANLIDDDTFDLEMIRSSIRQKQNLLEVEHLDSWKPLCDHIGIPAPISSFPKASTNTAAAAVIGRKNQIMSEGGKYLLTQLNYVGITYSASRASGSLSRTFFGQKLNDLILCLIGFACFIIARFIMGHETKMVDEPRLADPTPIQICASVPPHLRKISGPALPSLGRASTTTRSSNPAQSSRVSANGSPPRQQQSRGRQQNNDFQGRNNNNRKFNQGGRNKLSRAEIDEAWDLAAKHNKTFSPNRNERAAVAATNHKKSGSTVLNQQKPVSPAVSPVRVQQMTTSPARDQAKPASPPQNQQQATYLARPSSVRSEHWSAHNQRNIASHIAKNGPQARNQHKSSAQVPAKVDAGGIRPARVALPGAWGSYLQVVQDGDRELGNQAVANAEKFKDRSFVFNETFTSHKQ